MKATKKITDFNKITFERFHSFHPNFQHLAEQMYDNLKKHS